MTNRDKELYCTVLTWWDCYCMLATQLLFTFWYNKENPCSHVDAHTCYHAGFSPIIFLVSPQAIIGRNAEETCVTGRKSTRSRCFFGWKRYISFLLLFCLECSLLRILLSCCAQMPCIVAEFLRALKESLVLSRNVFSFQVRWEDG